MDINQLGSKIIGAAIEVHKALGPGLLESAYEKCLCHELKLRGLSFDNQKPLLLVFKGGELDCGYRLDIVVDNAIILELKSCEKPVMRDGIVRIANNLEE
jgi:GxxExxY protein